MATGTDVLVVGAGPVGLALAIELGMRGVKVRLVERNSRGGVAPRAKTTNIRTRTHLRRWGIADRLAEASPLGIDYPNDVKYVTRLSGFPLAHFKNTFNAAPIRAAEYPEHAQWVPQYTLERILLEHARSLPNVEISFGTRFLTADQDDETVASELQDGDGKMVRIASRYLVGADGARSSIRTLIGAVMEGRPNIGRAYNVIFRAPGLTEANRLGPGIMYWQFNRDGISIIGPMDRDDKWYFMPAGLKDGETLSHEAAAALIAKTTGIDLPYEILSADEWTASELLADRYRKGRIFLAGDACHLHPPFGGYGMNMGIGDGVDLGWKLAALLQGWGGAALPDSYQQERRTVHDIVIQEAVANMPLMIDAAQRAALEDDTPEGAEQRKLFGEQILKIKAREFHTLGTVLGLGYRASPLITFDDTLESRLGPPPKSAGQTYIPTACPGHLAPHAWLKDDRSLYDVFGKGFTLIVAEGVDEMRVERAMRDAGDLGVPFTVVRPDGVPVAGLYQADLALVRPDQHVAWRGADWDRAVLCRAIGK